MDTKTAKWSEKLTKSWLITGWLMITVTHRFLLQRSILRHRWWSRPEKKGFIRLYKAVDNHLNWVTVSKRSDSLYDGMSQPSLVGDHPCLPLKAVMTISNPNMYKISTQKKAKMVEYLNCIISTMVLKPLMVLMDAHSWLGLPDLSNGFLWLPELGQRINHHRWQALYQYPS